MSNFARDIEVALFEAQRPFAPKGENVDDFIAWLNNKKSPNESQLAWNITRHATEAGFETEGAYRRLVELNPFGKLDKEASNQWTPEEKKQSLTVAIVTAGALSTLSRSEVAFVNAFDKLSRLGDADGISVTHEDVKDLLARVYKADTDTTQSRESEGGGGTGALVLVGFLALGAWWLKGRKKKA